MDEQYRQTVVGRVADHTGVLSGRLGEASRMPVVDRLHRLRENLGQMSRHLAAFQQRMNGNPPEPEKHPGNGAIGSYPPCSIEDVLSQIEQHVNDISEYYTQIAGRF